MKRKDMIYFYEFVENNFLFRQFNVDDVLFTAYDCPLEGSPVDYYVKKNYFCYIHVGGGRWKTPTKDYYNNSPLRFKKLFKEKEALALI